VLPVWRTVADVTVEYYERGPAPRLPKNGHRVFDALDIVCVADTQYTPAVTHEAGSNVFGECQPRVAFDGDVIVVVDPAEVIEAKVTCERRGFRTDAFHQASVPAYGVDVIVKDVKVWLV